MSRLRVVVAIGLAVLLVGLVGLWLRPSGFPGFPPGIVLTRSVSPNQDYVAIVITAERVGHYLFEVRANRSPAVLARRNIAAPLGYHEHRITVEWEADPAAAVAIIDHDFGENPLRFKLAVDDE